MIPFAYVTGTFYTAAGASRANERITFQPLSTPYVVDGEVVLSVPVVVTLDSQGRIHDGNGNLRYKLAKGFYRVIASDTDAFNIEVPDDQANHDVASLTSEVSPSPVIGVQQILTPNDVFNTVEDSDVMEWSNSGPAHEDSQRIAFIGEVGDVSDEDYFLRWANEAKVRPVFVLGNANPGGAASTAATNFYQWVQFLEGYFHYALGTEDYLTSSEIDDVREYIGTAASPARYYKVSLSSPSAPIDVFVLDSNDDCPDGNTASSTQGLWLRDQLALSTARWKIVCFQAPPVCSVADRANSAMNWPFKSWGADLIVTGGGKASEYRVLSDGTRMVMMGTSGKGPYESMFGDSNYSYGQNTRRQALIVDVTASQLTIIMANVPKGSRWLQLAIQGKPDQRITVSPRFGWDSGLTVRSSLGVGLRPEPWGLANFHNSVGRFANYVIGQNYGTAIRLADVPTVEMARANPLLKHSLIIRSTESSLFEMHAWIPEFSEFRMVWASVVPHQGDTPATQQLTTPILSYDNANSVLGVEVSHATNGVDIWVSVNFGPFTLLSSWPALVLFEDPKADTPSVIAAYASKAGFIDSEIVTHAFAQDNQETIAPEGPGGV